ncbi:MAG: GTPase Era [Pseudomonadota bacterium]
MTTPSRCGYIAIIGRPNVGKSTLLNCILRRKVSITTEKPQTTRTQILGIQTKGADQYVYIDTPGLHEAGKLAMNRYMNRMATSVIGDADVILFMIEAGRFGREDAQALEKLQHVTKPVILVINKIDKLKDKALLLPFIEKVSIKFPFADVVPLSAKNADNVDALETVIAKFLPENPHFFPDDQITDKPINFQIGELIREKLIQATEQELPYSTIVEIENMEDKTKFIEINAIIWVERDGQKPIVIGKDGERLKKIGTRARKDIETLLERKVFLRLWVKVKASWTDNERALKNFGYE